jgi:hypothetical protein
VLRCLLVLCRATASTQPAAAHIPRMLYIQRTASDQASCHKQNLNHCQQQQLGATAPAAAAWYPYPSTPASYALISHLQLHQQK